MPNDPKRALTGHNGYDGFPTAARKRLIKRSRIS